MTDNVGAQPAVTDTPNSKELTLIIRVFGRVCFAPEGPLEGEKRFNRLNMIGVRMDKNPSLGFDTHFMTLTIPNVCVSFFTRRPDVTTFSNHVTRNDIEEYYVWNLSQCDVTISGLRDGDVTIQEKDDTERFADLQELTDGKGRLSSQFHADRARSAADCVLLVESGTLTPLSPLGARTVSYQPFDEGLTGRTLPKRNIADGAELRASASGNQVSFNIHRRIDNVKWSITVEKDVILNTNPILTFGNTCGCTVNSDAVDRDNEFAGYYELLDQPAASPERLIPVMTSQVISTATCDVPSLLLPL
jgi:hypothetical protein